MRLERLKTAAAGDIELSGADFAELTTLEKLCWETG